jgi:hypothetical protein
MTSQKEQDAGDARLGALGVGFTPGPWRVDPRNWGDIQTDDGKEIGSAFELGNVGEEWLITGDIPWPAPVARANARLIAAAPDLYEALELLVQWLSGPPDSSFNIADIKGLALTALRKARGE